MKRIFVYGRLFQLQLAQYYGSEAMAYEIENALLSNPEVGDIVPGTGGVRKFRLADDSRRKGKRGGVRIFYLDFPHAGKTHLLFILKKGNAEDVTADEKRLIRDLVMTLKKESKP